MSDLGAILKQYGVLREGHFLLTSGRHSDRYFEKFRILEHPQVCERFAAELAAHFNSQDITVVCGPTTGGVIVAYEVARQLNARCIVAERAETGRRIGRGFRLSSDDRVLLVDDVMTTGGSLRETLTALAEFPATVAGIGVFIDRSSGTTLPLPLYAAYRHEVASYEPADCPLCRKGLALEEPGRSGRTTGA